MACLLLTSRARSLCRQQAWKTLVVCAVTPGLLLDLSCRAFDCYGLVSGITGFRFRDTQSSTCATVTDLSAGEAPETHDQLPVDATSGFMLCVAGSTSQKFALGRRSCKAKATGVAVKNRLRVRISSCRLALWLNCNLNASINIG